MKLKIPKPRLLHSIDTAVLIMTGVITAALVGLVWYSINTLSSRDWCNQIMAAEKFTGATTNTAPETVQLVIKMCTTLLEAQLDSVGFVAKTLAGGLALCVVAMYLVKFAGGRASGEIAGNKFNIQGSTPEVATQAAERVAEAASKEAEEVKTEVGVEVTHPTIAEEEIKP